MKTNRVSLSHLAGVIGLAGPLLLNGCSANFGDVSNTPAATAMHIQGVVHGGQQPLHAAHVYMYAASTTGYGGNGIAASATNASTSLLTSAAGVTASDGTNFYATTDQAGNFNIEGSFACTPGTQVYLYSTGGDPQLNGVGTSSGSNSAAGMLAVVGDCASATPRGAFPNATFVAINEVTTIAAAYALAGFATDPTHIGAPSSVTGHSLSATGFTNAFNTALNLVNQATGLPSATTMASGSSGAVPVTLINALADILASCVNSTAAGPVITVVSPSIRPIGSAGCNTLFANTYSSVGARPADTAAAAINIAQNPENSVAALLQTIPGVPPFSPTISSAADFTLAVTYSGLNVPYGVAVDGLGNVFVTDSGTSGPNANSVTKLSPTGVASNFSSQGTAPLGVAVDSTNTAWVVNSQIGSDHAFDLVSFNSGGISTFNIGLNAPHAVSIDKNGDIWIADTGGNDVFDFNPNFFTLNTFPSIASPQGLASSYDPGTGTSQELVTSFAASGPLLNLIQSNTAIPASTSANTYLGTPLGVVVAQSFNVWVADTQPAPGQVAELSSSVQAPLNFFSGTPFGAPQFIAMDGSDTLWISNLSNGTVTTVGDEGGGINFTYTAGGTLNGAEGIAVDGSGNVWVANSGNNTVSQIVGAGTPVVTPLVASLLSPYTTPAAKP